MINLYVIAIDAMDFSGTRLFPLIANSLSWTKVVHFFMKGAHRGPSCAAEHVFPEGRVSPGRD